MSLLKTSVEKEKVRSGKYVNRKKGIESHSDRKLTGFGHSLNTKGQKDKF